MDGPKSFWTYKRTRHKIIAIHHHFLPCPFIGTNTFGQVQIIKNSPEKSNFEPVQNDLYPSKITLARPNLSGPMGGQGIIFIFENNSHLQKLVEHLDEF